MHSHVRLLLVLAVVLSSWTKENQFWFLYSITNLNPCRGYSALSACYACCLSEFRLLSQLSLRKHENKSLLIYNELGNVKGKETKH